MHLPLRPPAVSHPVLIRSVVIKDQRLRVHAGCGIVADSDPQAEAEEMGWKLRPLLEALA